MNLEDKRFRRTGWWREEGGSGGSRGVLCREGVIHWQQPLGDWRGTSRVAGGGRGREGRPGQGALTLAAAGIALSLGYKEVFDDNQREIKGIVPVRRRV